MPQSAPTPRMTVAEFVHWDDGTKTRYELTRGTPIAVAPPSGRHADITRNLARALDRQLVPPCRTPLGGGIACDEADDEFRLPDLFVTCEPTPPTYFRAPRLIVEVLSHSTEKEDRTDKLDFYKSLPSVEAVLLVWQDKRRAQLHLREGARWPAQDFIGTGNIELPSLGVALSLDEIYAGIELPDENSEPR